MAEINLGNDETINATLSTEEPITSEVLDINYIPGYVVAEQERRANEIVRQSNEADRIALYNDMEYKLETGYFKGDKGDPGVKGDDAKINGVNTLTIQAGQNIDISQTGSTMTISSTGGGGASEYVVRLTKENDEITSDKTISEIITAYNNGNIVKGVLTDTEIGVDFNLQLLIAFEDSEFGLVQFATVYDSGDDFKSITIIGTLEDNEDSWQYLDKEIVSDSDYVHTDNNYTNAEKTKLAGLENKIITINADQQTMQLDKNADEIEEYLNNGYIVMALGYQVFRKDYNASTHTIQLAIFFGAFGQVITVTGNQVTGVSEYFYVNDQNYVHTDNNFTYSYRNKLDATAEVSQNNLGLVNGGQVYDAINWVVDLTSYSVGDTISDADIVAKLKDGRTVIYYDGIYYRLAAIYGTGYVFTTMSGTDHGQWITLNYNSGANTFYVYENDTANWEVPSNKVQNLNNPTTDTYPSTLAVYNALQNTGGDSDFVDIGTKGAVNLGTTEIQNIINKLNEHPTVPQVYCLSKPSGYRNTTILLASLDPDETLSTSKTSYVLNIYSYNTQYQLKSLDMVYQPYNVTISWSGNVPTVTASSLGTRVNNSIYMNGNTSSWTPSTNYSPSTKKYVDDKPTTYTGYDATKTQVLKNVSGTLTWEAGETYSTSETLTNKVWIDGKPIYRKVITYSGPNATTLLVSHNISNFDSIWINEGASFMTNGTTQSLPLNWFNSVGDSLRTTITTNRTQVQSTTPANLSSFTFYVTLEYTKTTT